MKKARMLSLFTAIVMIAGTIPMMANAQTPAAPAAPTPAPAPPADPPKPEPPKPTLEGLAAGVSVQADALKTAKDDLQRKLKGKASKSDVAKIRKDLARIGEAEKKIEKLEKSRNEAQLAADKAKSEEEITKAEGEVIKDLASQLEDEAAAATIQAYLDRKASDGRVAVRGALVKDCPKGWAIGKLSVRGDSLVLRCVPAKERVYEAFSAEKESDVLKAKGELAEKSEARATSSFGAVLGRGLVGGVLIGTGAGLYSATQADPGHKLQDGLLNGALWGVVGTGATALVDVIGRAAGFWK